MTRRRPYARAEAHRLLFLQAKAEVFPQMELMMARNRERISPRGDTRFVRRDEQGRFTESDDAGRSLSQDRKKKASTRVKKGQGDKGDR